MNDQRTLSSNHLLLAMGLLLACVPTAAGQGDARLDPETAAKEARLAQFRQFERRYELGPDSLPQPGVPQGKVTTHIWNQSKVFPGTIRRYYVYVPAQYSPSQPAALMVFQDGHTYIKEDGDFRVPTVFDNLIHAGEMPVTIGVFIDPGFKRDELPPEPGWQPRPENRSFEYDSLSTDYADFLLNEILPEVSKQYRLTDDPEGRAIGGISSGGICAFTVAWNRPDQFRKVLSHVGSFADIRGGHRYPEIVREAEYKPIKIFMQDGSEDLRRTRKNWNWVVANLNLASALEEKVYDYKFVRGEGGHNGNHGGAILPNSLRWLWHGYRLPTDGSQPKVLLEFNGRSFNGFYTYVNDRRDDDSQVVFSITDEGWLRISGTNQGYLSTAEALGDYRLIAEYKWGSEDPASDSGIFFHAVPEDRLWSTSLEVQMRAGATGDLCLIGSGASLDANGSTHNRGCIERPSSPEPEQPKGQWNRIELTCRGRDVQVVINGHQVLEGSNSHADSGRVFFQSYKGELFYRKIVFESLE